VTETRAARRRGGTRRSNGDNRTSGVSYGRGPLSRNGRSPGSETRGQSLTCARRDLNRVRPTLVLTELGSLSVK
jgi:hypothetical protein